MTRLFAINGITLFSECALVSELSFVGIPPLGIHFCSRCFATESLLPFVKQEHHQQTLFVPAAWCSLNEIHYFIFKRYRRGKQWGVFSHASQYCDDQQGCPPSGEVVRESSPHLCYCVRECISPGQVIVFFVMNVASNSLQQVRHWVLKIGVPWLYRAHLSNHCSLEGQRRGPALGLPGQWFPPKQSCNSTLSSVERRLASLTTIHHSFLMWENTRSLLC